MERLLIGEECTVERIEKQTGFIRTKLAAADGNTHRLCGECDVQWAKMGEIFFKGIQVRSDRIDVAAGDGARQGFLW